MKKFTICFIVMLMLGGIFGLTMQNINTPVLGAVVGEAYAEDYPCIAGPHTPPGRGLQGN